MLVNAESLTLSFNERSSFIFKDITLELAEHELACISGPNGSGKTLLGISISGLLPLFSGNWRLDGSVQMFGEIVIQGKPHADLSVVLENPYTQLSGMKREVLQEMAFPLECLGVERDIILEKVHELAGVFGIASLLKRNIRTLSGGELQRMIVACAIITNPAFLFLDRPLTEIDSEFRKSLIAYLKSYVRDTTATALIAEDPWLLDMEKFDSHIAIGEIDYSSHCDVFDCSATSTNENILNIDGLSFSYDRESPLIDSLDLSLKRGELLFIDGKNGSGKTTLAKLIAGIIVADGGSISIGGKRAESLEEWARLSEVGYALQDPSVQICRNSVAEELALAERCGNPAGEFETILGLDALHDKHPFELMQAEKKHLGMALACGGNRKVVILDEPSQNQDNIAFARTARAVIRCLEMKRGVIVISHDPRFQGTFPAASRITLA